MTKAQTSFLKAIPAILQELEFSPPPGVNNYLISLFDNNGKGEGKSIWDLAIKSVMASPLPDKIDNLIDQLSDQAVDDPLTMSKIVGWDATLILLRIYNENKRTFIRNVAVNQK